MLGEDFLKKLKNVKKYYQGEPEIDKEFDIFKDTLNFLTINDIQLLVYKYIQEHTGDPTYNLANIRVIEDLHQFGNMQQYLGEIGKLNDGMDLKLLLKIKKGEPAHYSPNFGVHVIFAYMRCEGEALSIFILDQAAGVICETRDGFVNMISVIEAYAKQFYGSDKYKLIKATGINQGDGRNCPMFVISAFHYFTKDGDKFFTSIKDYIVPKEQMVFDLDKDNIFHLRADGLPAKLVKMTNRRTLKRVNEAYRHKWNPVQVQLTPAYGNDDLVEHLLNHPVGKNPQKTLIRYFEMYGETRQGVSGEYIYNTSADCKMKKARKTILGLLRTSGVIESTEGEEEQLNEDCLTKLFNKIKPK